MTAIRLTAPQTRKHGLFAEKAQPKNELKNMKHKRLNSSSSRFIEYQKHIENRAFERLYCEELDRDSNDSLNN